MITLCSEQHEQPYVEVLGPCLTVGIGTILGKPEITDLSGEVRDYFASGHHRSTHLVLLGI